MSTDCLLYVGTGATTAALSKHIYSDTFQELC